MLREQIQGLRAAQDMAADIAAFDVKYQYRAATAPVDVTYGSYVRFPAMLLFDDSFDSIDTGAEIAEKKSAPACYDLVFQVLPGQEYTKQRTYEELLQPLPDNLIVSTSGASDGGIGPGRMNSDWDSPVTRAASTPTSVEIESKTGDPPSFEGTSAGMYLHRLQSVGTRGFQDAGDISECCMHLVTSF